MMVLVVNGTKGRADHPASKPGSSAPAAAARLPPRQVQKTTSRKDPNMVYNVRYMALDDMVHGRQPECIPHIEPVSFSNVALLYYPLS